MARLYTFWTNHLKEFKSNKRLQYGSIAILLIALIDGGLRWSDRLTVQTRELHKLAGEITTLKQQALDESAFKNALDSARQARKTVDTRLWTAPTDAIGQARLKDWLLDISILAGIASPKLNLANPKPLQEMKDTARGPFELSARSGGLKRFPATLSFRFTPEALERCLAEIEGGEPFALVDSLVINKSEMRVEIGLSMLIRIVTPTEEPTQ